MLSFEEYQKSIQRVDPERDATCPVSRALTLFSSKWNLRVLFELSKTDSMRFGQLKKQIPGITNTMLSGTLKLLEEKGLVHRTQYNEIPPHTEYSLSESGKGLYAVFISILEWSRQYAVGN
ncbi:MAG: winged helix-turn-helix transcriptional regulator [Blautia massiliensis (ex Durand et al. 2017)]